ncbi:hypothetical protein EGW08_012862 [Elysia chlorotica]|uniref:Uncharacterized protein n=1 Tax=Elysia chlorotica TaxID=188477 RepID=A0A3S0ZJU4_ELYCH|nr:hypothetical protein EGW08_012862 [Elysia chlorotica]
MAWTGESPREAGVPTTLLKTKTKTRIGTWDMRTLCKTRKIAQVCGEMNSYNLKILGLRETRWTGAGKAAGPYGIPIETCYSHPYARSGNESKLQKTGKETSPSPGRGFDQETFSEKDEGAVCHYNIGGVEAEKAVGGLKPEWDLDHPGMPQPRSNAAILLLGRNVWAIGGLSYNKGTGVNTVNYYDIKRRRWREAFHMPEGHYSNLDGVLLHIPVTNKDFCFVDRFIYDRWIMW